MLLSKNQCRAIHGLASLLSQIRTVGPHVLVCFFSLFSQNPEPHIHVGAALLSSLKTCEQAVMPAWPVLLFQNYKNRLTVRHLLCSVKNQNRPLSCSLWQRRPGLLKTLSLQCPYLCGFSRPLETFQQRMHVFSVSREIYLLSEPRHHIYIHSILFKISNVNDYVLRGCIVPA